MADVPTPSHSGQPQPRQNDCEHYWASNVLGGFPIAVRACRLCQEIDWDDLRGEVKSFADRIAVAIESLPVKRTYLSEGADVRTRAAALARSALLLDRLAQHRVDIPTVPAGEDRHA